MGEAAETSPPSTCKVIPLADRQKEKAKKREQEIVDRILQVAEKLTW